MTVPPVPSGAPRTVVEVLARTAERHPDVEAYVEPAHSSPGRARPRACLTFGEWDRAADGVAGMLARHGVGHGDVVALVLPSCIDYAVAYAALLRLGAVTSGCNPRLGPAELTSIIGRARPVLTVVDPELGVELPAGAGAVLPRAAVAESADGPPPARRTVLDPDDPVAVVWTSGTTGRPKGAVFDHRSLEAVAAGTDVLAHPGDRRLSPLPFAHVGYMTRPWEEISRLITTVITPVPWRAEEALRILVDERITVGQGVPTQWTLILALPGLDAADLSALRLAGTGAAPVPAALVAEMRRRLRTPVVVRYTSTETSRGTGTDLTDPDDVVANTVGRPVAGVELSVVGGDGRAVPAGEVGRVRLRSGAVMRGYWGDPTEAAGGMEAAPAAGGSAPRFPVDRAATDAVLSPDGWITTGDYGWVDDDGNLHLAGRANEMYIRGGYNVYPTEVEETLGSHPAVARAAVVGAPDPVLGAVGVAFVVPAVGVGRDGVPPLAELRAFCGGRLADYKSPDAVVVVDELPLTPMMKVDKKSLADPAREAAERRRGPGADPTHRPAPDAGAAAPATSKEDP
jgi:acyl-CoA synthetase (AMP-forming)/AMP-acid ligase II